MKHQENVTAEIKLPNIPDFEMTYNYHGLNIAGSQHYDVSYVKHGKSVEFKAEPENEHDPNAIAVMFNRQKIGYVPKNRLQKMMHDFIARNDLVQAQISYIGSDGLKMSMDFYESIMNMRKKSAMYKTFKVTGNRNEEMQSNISLYSVGEEVTADYDYDKEKYQAVCGLEIGYFPKVAEVLLERGVQRLY
jgi:hypothetical protein